MKPWASRREEGLDEILGAAEPAPAAAPAIDLEDRIAGAWLGRAVGCDFVWCPR